MSSLTGDGMKEFFDAVDDAKEEYLRYVSGRALPFLRSLGLLVLPSIPFVILRSADGINRGISEAQIDF